MSLSISELRETHIESRLCREVKKLGGIPYKFTSPQRRSVPDRLCTFPYGILWFVECKRPKGKPTKLQQKELDRSKKLGFNATYVNTYEAIDTLMLTIYNQIKLKQQNEILS